MRHAVLAASLSATNNAVVDEQFRADFLVQNPTFQGFPAQFGDQMEDVDGVGLVSRQQGTPVSVEIDGTPDQSFAIGVDDAFFEIYELTMVDGEDSISGREVLLSEGRADDLSAGVGDTVDVSFPGGETLQLNDRVGLNPRLTALKRFWDTGQLAIVEGVGYPSADLSHFSSMAIWMSGIRNGLPSSGWIGRWLDGHLPGGPDLYTAASIGSVRGMPAGHSGRREPSSRRSRARRSGSVSAR